MTEDQLELFFDLVAPWVGYADCVDDLNDPYIGIDVSNEEIIKERIRQDLLPYFKTLSLECQTLGRTVIEEMIADEHFDVTDLFQGNYFPFNPWTENPKAVLKWLLEVFYSSPSMNG